MKQTNSLSIMNPKKNFTNSSSKKNFSSKITTSYNQILQESISDSSRQKQRNTSNSYKQNFNQNTSTPVTVLRGDANNDGRVDRKDIDLIVQRMCDDIEGKSDKTKINMMNSDYDNDGVITLDDFSVAVENLNKQEKTTVNVLHGDANDDGVVDEKDKELVLNRFFADMEGKGHTVKVNMRNVDFSGDGKITLEDFSRFMEIYNEQQKQSKTILKGDVNGDGKINQKDLDLISARTINAGLDRKFVMEAADMNNNGKIDNVDVFKVKQLVKEHEYSVKTLQGDSNGDGVVDETDYKNIKDYFSDKDSSEDFIMKNADINGDKEIDKKDLQGVRNILDGRKIDWDESKRLLGDVNGDGKIDVVNDAMTIINYLNGEIQKKDFYWDNADVNHDGKIDAEDANRIMKYVNGEIPTLDYEAPSEPSILGDVNGDGVVDVVNDAVLLNRYIKGEDIGNQTIHLNVADVNKDGMINEDDVHGIENIFNGRRIDWKPDPVPPDPDPIPAPVIEVAPPFTNGEVKFKAEVFGDLTLTWKVNADEKVFAGETVRVTGMSSDGKALKIVYSSVYGVEKERWVSADAIEEYKIPPILQDLINTWEGKIWKNETTGKGNFECKDFAAYVFRKMYGVWYIGSTRSKDTGNNYRISINNPDRVGVRGEYEYLTKHNAQSLFSGAEAGDFVQMRRTHGGSHSAIVAGVTNEGVWFFEANAPDPDGSNYVYNKVKLQFHSWENLSEKNSSMSVYYAK